MKKSDKFEITAMLKPKKRGRPRKIATAANQIDNAIAMLKRAETPVPVETFNQALDRMDDEAARAAHEANIQRLIAERAPVQWEEIAQRQELELNVLRQENEELARICVMRYESIEDWKKIVTYLEGRLENLAIRSR